MQGVNFAMINLSLHKYAIFLCWHYFSKIGFLSRTKKLIPYKARQSIPYHCIWLLWGHLSITPQFISIFLLQTDIQVNFKCQLHSPGEHLDPQFGHRNLKLPLHLIKALNSQTIFHGDRIARLTQPAISTAGKVFRKLLTNHDDVIKWNHFPRYWPFVRGIHRPPVNSPHKGQWRGALMFFVICV